MNHANQKQILDMRESLRAGLAPKQAGELDAKLFEQLRKLAPAGLPPVMIQRNHDEWIACYLIDAAEATKRFLVIADGKWLIQWAKRSANVLQVPESALEAFDKLLVAQETCWQAREALIAKSQARGNGKCTSSKKASKSRTRTKAAASST